jgi:6-phosphogluconolactonase (cycloisomerase 2 family)
MKLMKFGKAILMCAASAAVALSITSCVESYATGYLYVTGTITAQSTGNGIISGFSIDHNTGKLTSIHGLPISSGGANPVRAALITGSRFFYVLNRGTNSAGGSDCTTADPCQNANITEFSVGGNGILTAQETFYTQGINPFRLVADPNGNFLIAMDHDAPDSAAYAHTTPTAGNPNSCMQELGVASTSCGDVTIFAVNQNTGRLSLVVNNQVTAATGSALTYFPVPANPIDFALSPSYLLALSGTPATGDEVFPYAYNSSTGQLTINQNSTQPLGIYQATAIINGGGYVYVLDNEGTDVVGSGATSQILPFSVGTSGALQAQTGGVVADDPTLNNPIQLLVESKGKYLYVANQGNNTTGNNAESGYSGYVIDPSTHQLSFIAGQPFGAGSGPQCIVEDPSDQYVYSADANDSYVTGRDVDPNSGVLRDLVSTSQFSIPGPATWCVMNGRTN